MTKYDELSEIFENSNARNLDADQLSEEFIWTEPFNLLFSPQNHIILGSRGSGKTALIKMLAHENLCRIGNKYYKAKNAINNKDFVATYVPLKIEWINSLSNYCSDYIDDYFKWSLNLSLCVNLLDTLRSCISYYILDEIEKLRKEKEICKKISTYWLENTIINTIDELRVNLEEIEYKKNLIFNKESMKIELTTEEKNIGSQFNTSLFKPFTIASKTIHKELNFPKNCKWYVCIDEAEFLTERHQKILNTNMRTVSDLVFKITTMPYRHKTLETNVDANINVGHDLEYIYIDKLGTAYKNQQLSDQKIQEFAEKLFENRLKSHNSTTLTLANLVGESILTQSTSELVGEDELLNLIRKHCNEDTITRTFHLHETDSKQFDDSVVRKLRGILVLREEYNNKIGNSASELYSGVSIISRCSDGNPRRLYRLFNHLLNNTTISNKPISNKVQSERLKSYSYKELEVIKLGKGGVDAFEFINKIGNYFKQQTLDEKLGSDVPQSFTINNISDIHWECIKAAVDLGLIYPYLKKDKNMQNLFPPKQGKFILANCLAPYFNLFPRVGRSVDLNTITNTNSSNISQYEFILNNEEVTDENKS